ncbi:TPM domain-containing protein [Tabrizicola sp.]|uniref:TPM domain-containing protein n=1 Tax=Tabrizicola sp. TaxID=2005166 RepID=UPI003F36B09D
MLFRLIIVLLFLPLSVLADGLPRPQSDAVSDFANLLPAAEEAEVRALVQEIRKETGVQVVVVTMEEIEQYGGRYLGFETYATKLFNEWGIGDAERNDGIMILVAPGDRATRIELGSGFSSAYDARAQAVIDKAMLPDFRERLFAQGILDGVKGVRDEVVQPFVDGKVFGIVDFWRKVLIGLGVIGGGAGLFFAGKAAWAAYKRCPQCSQLSLERWNEVTDYATEYSTGSGITHLSCALCGYTEDRHYTISRKSDRSSSGGGGGGSSSSGGFGGGSSSGGGASGRW